MGRFEREKVIMNRKMAAFLVLCGCKLNRTRTDLARPVRLVYFFENSDKLNLLMGVYSKFRDNLSKMYDEANRLIEDGSAEENEEV